MPQELIAVITIISTMLSSFFGVIVSNKLTLYRIEQLEKKVEYHNSIVHRMAVIEDRLTMLQKNIDIR